MNASLLKPHIAGIQTCLAYHERQAAAWHKSSTECRDSLAFFEKDLEARKRMEEQRGCSWEKTQAHNLSRLEWDDKREAEETAMANTLRSVLEIISPTESE